MLSTFQNTEQFFNSANRNDVFHIDIEDIHKWKVEEDGYFSVILKLQNITDQLIKPDQYRIITGFYIKKSGLQLSANESDFESEYILPGLHIEVPFSFDGTQGKKKGFFVMQILINDKPVIMACHVNKVNFT